jgi:hypothetical protein
MSLRAVFLFLRRLTMLRPDDAISAVISKM